MTAITTEWESATTRLVRYLSHVKGPNFPLNYKRSARYKQIPGRKIRRLIVHQSAGGRRDGQSAVDRMAQWIIRAPKYAEKRGKMRRVGGGRGFPAIPYSFLVPHRPAIEDGKSIVYRLWDDNWQTWHTKGANRDGVGVCFAGSFRTRHSPKFSDQDPTNQALAAGKDLIMNYLLPRYGLDVDDLAGHFDHGKSMCPGDCLEHWVRTARGETVRWFDATGAEAPKLDNRPLGGRGQQNDALVELGYDDFDLSTAEDRKTAIAAFQADEGCTPDGYWGPQTERAMRIALAEIA